MPVIPAIWKVEIWRAKVQGYPMEKVRPFVNKQSWVWVVPAFNPSSGQPLSEK
jgi:hypothetical protein